MDISRGKFLRAALTGAALLPGAAFASPGEEGAFRSNLASDAVHPWTASPGIGKSPLRFAVIGDNTGLARPGVFDQAMTQLTWLQPDFVLSVGDLIEGYTEDRAKIASQWNAIEASIAKLNCPFVYAPGNHDLNNAETVEAWRARRGATYFSFTYKGALFLVLNTEDPPLPMPAQMADGFNQSVAMMQADPDKAQKLIDDYIAAMATGGRPVGEASHMAVVNIGDRQLAWIRDTLARHPNPQWTFVIMHKPAWKAPNDWMPVLSARGLLSPTVSPEFLKIKTMLTGRPYTVFAGHTHSFTHDVIDGRDYINMATTGGIRQDPGSGTMDHTMLVTLTPNGPVYANTRFKGLMNVAGETGQIRAY